MWKLGKQSLKQFTWASIVVFIAIGVELERRAESYSLVFQTIQYATVDGKVQSAETIKRQPAAEMDQILSTLSYTIAISIFVSVIIIKRMEDARQEESLQALEFLRKQIQSDVLSATMGKVIPPEVFSVLKRDVLEKALVVQSGIWDLTFTLESDGRIKLLTDFFYVILNTSEKEVNEETDVLTTPVEDGGLESLLVKLDGVESCKYIVSTKENKGAKFIEQDHTSKIVYNLRIPPQKTAEIHTRYVDFFAKTAIDTIFTKHPTQELLILVRFPEGWTFNLNSFSSSPLECIDRNPNACKYRFDGGLLPCQGVMFTLVRTQNVDISLIKGG